MQTRAISQRDMTDFVRRLLDDYLVMAPMEIEPGFYKFEVVEDPQDVVLNYVTTVLPPKKALFPPRQVLFQFQKDGDDGKPEFEPVITRVPQVILGVHPCDLAGIAMLDWAFSRDLKDEHYLAQRRATLLIGVDCHPDEHCFCTEVGTQGATDGFDLFLTPIEDGFLIRVGTEKGGQLLATYAITRDATPEDIARTGQFQKEKASLISRRFDAEIYTLPLTFQNGFGSRVWEETSAACLSCGSCNLVCPTCFCFDIEDVVDANGKSGVCQRIWDACQLSEFARVAGGHNFRAQPHQRLRHRFYRKYQYLMMQYGMPFCTGCGRCGRSCPVDINVVDTVNALVSEPRKEGRVHA